MYHCTTEIKVSPYRRNQTKQKHHRKVTEQVQTNKTTTYKHRILRRLETSKQTYTWTHQMIWVKSTTLKWMILSRAMPMLKRERVRLIPMAVTALRVMTTIMSKVLTHTPTKALKSSVLRKHHRLMYGLTTWDPKHRACWQLFIYSYKQWKISYSPKWCKCPFNCYWLF